MEKLISNIENILKNAKKLLKESSVENCSLDAEILLCHVLGLSREKLLLNYSTIISNEQNLYFDQLLKRRINFEPISHIIGKREFYGRDFMVSNKVLDPRPDSETLIDAALKLINNLLKIRQSQNKMLGKNIKVNYSMPFDNATDYLNLIDLGCGSGCLALTLLCENESLQATLVDISEDALEIAQINTQNLKISPSRIKFIKSNWWQNVEEKFDLIISNPPYIKLEDKNSLQKEIIKHEPHIALFGGLDGFDCYKIIAKDAKKFLKKNGYIILEHGINQETQITDIFAKHGFNLIERYFDLGGVSRCLLLQ